MNKIVQFSRPLVVKVATRAILWGLISGLGMSATQAEEPATAAAEGIAAVLLAIAAFLLDAWHHKTDKAEAPQ